MFEISPLMLCNNVLCCYGTNDVLLFIITSNPFPYFWWHWSMFPSGEIFHLGNFQSLLFILHCHEFPHGSPVPDFCFYNCLLQSLEFQLFHFLQAVVSSGHVTLLSDWQLLSTFGQTSVYNPDTMWSWIHKHVHFNSFSLILILFMLILWFTWL